MKMTDYLGNELEIGDKIVYIQQYSNSSHFSKGVIAGFTNCFVVMKDGTRKAPDKIIKISGE